MLENSDVIDLRSRGVVVSLRNAVTTAIFWPKNADRRILNFRNGDFIANRAKIRAKIDDVSRIAGFCFLPSSTVRYYSVW